MVAWRVAKSLLELKSQWQQIHPGAANPGFIGDAAHASRDSDHNPWVDDPASTLNVVTAGDFYHQPDLGADAYKLADAIKAAKDPRVKYVISRRKIWSLARDHEGWRPYDGANPHTGHTHVSVSATKSLYDNTRSWSLPGVQTEDDVTPEQMTTLLSRIDAATVAAKAATSAANGAIAAAKQASTDAANASETAGRRWALYVLRYGLQTEDERDKAREVYAERREAGDTTEQAMAAAAAVLQPLDDQLEITQGKG